MDETSKRMAQVQWTWAGKDPVALAELEARIAKVGRNRGVITYSDLARDVIFHLPNVRNGEAFSINIYNWSGFERHLIGEFLGYISMQSYNRHKFMASALVVGTSECEPSFHFYDWMRKLGVLPDTEDATTLAFWGEQLRAAHGYYTGRRRS